jgi:hypothetical protein
VAALDRMAEWFRSQCDGDWEHGQGIRIETLDNPGWSVTIDLRGTKLERTPFAEVKDDYASETRWLRCWRDDGAFHAACGPMRLEDVLNRFLSWVEQAPSA